MGDGSPRRSLRAPCQAVPRGGGAPDSWAAGRRNPGHRARAGQSVQAGAANLARRARRPPGRRERKARRIYGRLTLTIAHSRVPARTGSAPARRTGAPGAGQRSGPNLDEGVRNQTGHGPKSRSSGGCRGASGRPALPPTSRPPRPAPPASRRRARSPRWAPCWRTGGAGRAGERRRALARGRSLLDELDLIRIGLLWMALCPRQPSGAWQGCCRQSGARSPTPS